VAQPGREALEPPERPLRYVALGDSYTIGISVTEAERWPNQLVAALATTPRPLELVANVAVNGFTSGNVIDVELPVLERLRPGFLSLLVGVNDVIQGVPPDRYRLNVERMVDTFVRTVGAAQVLCVTTPDYTVTPAGAGYGDPARMGAGIRGLNAILAEVAQSRGVGLADVYDLSLLAAEVPGLVARDGLHPNGAQYGLWVERMLPVVAANLAG
jgi:acyl-CoA thioesterase-1